MKKAITTPHAPRPRGPYSQAIAAGGFLFIAGQVPVDPATGALVGGSVAEQTARVLESLTAILEAAGGSRASVVQTKVYLRDLGKFAEMNEVYARYFDDGAPPVRTTIGATLRERIDVEIDAIAVLG